MEFSHLLASILGGLSLVACLGCTICACCAVVDGLREERAEEEKARIVADTSINGL